MVNEWSKRERSREGGRRRHGIIGEMTISTQSFNVFKTRTREPRASF